MPKTEGKHTERIWVRIDTVANLILENDRYFQSKRSDELAEIVAERFDVDERTARRYISEAKREVRKLGKKHNINAFKKAIRDREYLFTKAKEGKNYKLALEVVKDRDELNGLYVQEIKHTGEIAIRNVDFAKLTDEQLATLERKIKNKEDVNEYLRGLGF